MEYKNDIHVRPFMERLRVFLRLPPAKPKGLKRSTGAGELYCNNCGYRERVIFFLHGLGPGNDHTLGYQCQRCGAFKSIGNALRLKKIPACQCGGRLRSNRLIFCPACHSRDLQYHKVIIT